MDALLAAHFPPIKDNNCLEVNTSNIFYVYDAPDGRCRADTTMPTGQSFVVDNPDGKAIRLLAVDHCMLFDGDGRRCDFALYDETCLSFVELKDVGGDDHQKRRAAKKVAKVQLIETITLFQNNLPSSAFSGITLEAYLCIGRRTARPATRSASQAARRDFAQKGVRLYDGCGKVF